MYPQKTWECGICGTTNPGDIGFCTSCRSGSLERGGLDNNSVPYFPVWHVKQHLQSKDRPPYELHDGYLPEKERYPHHKRSIRV